MDIFLDSWVGIASLVGLFVFIAAIGIKLWLLLRTPPSDD